jgi:hypothetical protein
LIPKVGEAVALLENVVEDTEPITDDELFDVVEDEEALEVCEVEITEGDELCTVEEVVGITTLDVLDVPDTIDALDVLDFVLEVVDATLLLLLETTDASSYISSLLPAPQYSY